MRIIAISDIHGCYYEFKELLVKVKYTPNKDRLIILGDLVDRGTHSKEVVRYVMELQKNGIVDVIKGNHDQFFYDWVYSQEESDINFLHPKVGGLMTIQSFMNGLNYASIDEVKRVFRSYYKKELDYLNNLPLYIETEYFAFVHAGIDPMFFDWKNTPNNEFMLIRHKFLFNPHEHDITFVFGHTPTYYLNEDKSSEIWVADKKIGIDGGCVFGGQLNALIIEGEDYYSESVHKVS